MALYCFLTNYKVNKHLVCPKRFHKYGLCIVSIQNWTFFVNVYPVFLNNSMKVHCIETPSADRWIRIKSDLIMKLHGQPPLFAYVTVLRGSLCRVAWRDAAWLFGLAGWEWLSVAGCGWVRLGVAESGWVWLSVTENGWVWLSVVECGWVWLSMAENGWEWLSVAECSWVWLSVTVSSWVAKYGWMRLCKADCSSK